MALVVPGHRCSADISKARELQTMSSLFQTSAVFNMDSLYRYDKQ